MTEIVVEGSNQEIAQAISRMPSPVVKAILVVENGQSACGASAEDAWTQDFRRWAASHRQPPHAVDDSRESIYQDRLKCSLKLEP